MNKTIDLENFRTQLGSVKSKVFTGRDRGEEVQWENNGYDISSQLDEAIERILQNKTGLD